MIEAVHTGNELSFVSPNRVCKFRAETLLTKEPATIAWIEAMPADAVFYDIGANVGLYSVYAARRGIETIAIEPVPESYAALCRNIALNSLCEHVTPLCMAAAHDNGVVSIRETDNWAGIGEVNFRDMGLKVPMLKLADMATLFGLSHPTHVKIDTDGHELPVLLGMGNMLNTVQSVIVETRTDRDAQCAVRSYLETGGFELKARFVSPLTPQSPIGMDHWYKEP